MKIENGWEQLGYKPFSAEPRDAYLEVVLSKTDSETAPYCTHYRNKSNPERTYLFAGHYHESLLEALIDFHQRGVKVGRKKKDGEE